MQEQNRSGYTLEFSYSNAKGIDLSSGDADIKEGAEFYVGVTGNIKVMTLKGSIVTLKNVPAGKKIPIIVKKIYASDTTASQIIVFNKNVTVTSPSGCVYKYDFSQACNSMYLISI